jgi:hypothetical protein
MTSMEETSPAYPSSVGRVTPVGIWSKPRMDVTANRVGIAVSDPEYYTNLYDYHREADINFWWKGRVPTPMNHTMRLYSASALKKQEEKAKRKQRKEQCHV